VTPARFPTGKLFAFVALGGLDFALTRYLFRTGGEAVREANLVAAWWLGHYGWLGLAGFKAGMIALAAGLGVVIYLRRPAAGHRVLGFGCAAAAAVVLYSAYLCHDLRSRPDRSESDALASASDRLDTGLRRARDYQQTVAELARDLRGRRTTLEEAVARVAATEQARDPKWLGKFQLFYPGASDSECIAISLINHMEQADGGGALGGELRAEFRNLYGRPVPPPAGPGGESLLALRPRVQ
jgi:hypothetical protein